MNDDDREWDEEPNTCPGCGNDLMDGHKMDCEEPLAETIADVADELLDEK